MYRKILLAQPDYTEAWLQLGEVCVRLGRCDEGTACYRQAIQLHAHSLSACVNLGNTLKNHGRLPEAIAAFDCPAADRIGFERAVEEHAVEIEDDLELHAWVSET